MDLASLRLRIIRLRSVTEIQRLRMRALRLLSRSVLLALPVLAACGGGGGSGEPKGKAAGRGGGTAIFDVLGDFQAFNPVVNTHSTTRDVQLYMLFTPSSSSTRSCSRAPTWRSAGS